MQNFRDLTEEQIEETQDFMVLLNDPTVITNGYAVLSPNFEIIFETGSMEEAIRIWHQHQIKE